MTGVFLDPTDKRWADFLGEVPHDVYHLPAYATLASRCEGGEPAAFYVREGNDAMLVPLLLRQVPHLPGCNKEMRDATSPYGYPSPLFSRPERIEACRNLLLNMVEVARSQGMVTLFLRLHPLLGCPLEAFPDNGDLVQHGQTVSINLARPLEEIIRDTSSNHRRGLRKLAQAGFHVVLDEWNDYPEFIRLYRETMNRIGAHPFYQFEGTYFDDLRHFLKPNLHLCSVCSAKGELASAGLFTVVGDLVEYHLGCSSEEYLKLAPSKMMFDFMRRWGHEKGLRLLHLGGGLGGQNDSLFDFKAGFSSEYTPFHTFRLVLEKSAYSALCAARQKLTDAPGGSDDFFPLYRKPL
jgi:hypothetical protein